MTSILLSCDSFPVFKQVAWVLGIIMNAIFELLNLIGIPNIGLAIILFTILVYLLMMPLTIKQQKFSKLSAKMNPEIQAIQNKYKNRKDTDSQMQMNTEIQSVYAKYGVSPSGSCLQLLIQMPILFSLYSVINRMPHYVNKLGESFNALVSSIRSSNLMESLYNEVPKLSTYVKDISNVDDVTLIDALNRVDFSDVAAFAEQHGITEGIADIERYNSFLVKGFSLANSPSSVVSSFFNNNAAGTITVLMLIIAISIPVLSAVTQWINVLLMPKPEENKGGNEMQDTMASSMKTMNMIMPLMSAFFCYSFPAGLGLYWIIGSVVRSVQQVIINKKIDKMDLNELIAKNSEKSAKKIEKLKENQAKYTQYANMNTKNINTTNRNYVNKPVDNEKETTTKTTPSNAKPGSLMARANLVKDYNERNNKN